MTDSRNDIEADGVEAYLAVEKALVEWVEAGADAICEHVRSRRTPEGRENHVLYCPECERTAFKVLRAVLPLIDALGASGIRAERQVVTDLRAEVEDLFVLSLFSGDYVNRAEVLALFGGGGDD